MPLRESETTAVAIRDRAFSRGENLVRHVGREQPIASNRASRAAFRDGPRREVVARFTEAQSSRLCELATANEHRAPHSSRHSVTRRPLGRLVSYLISFQRPVPHVMQIHLLKLARETLVTSDFERNEDGVTIETSPGVLPADWL